MRIKRRNVEIVGIVVIALLTFIGQAIFFPDDEIEFADTIDFTSVSPYEIVTLGAGEEGDIKALKFDADGVIFNNDVIGLMGATHFTGRKNDLLMFKYEDGVWVELGRYLSEE